MQIKTKPRVKPIPVKGKAKPSKAELDLKAILKKDARSSAHAFNIAHVVGVYPA